MRILVTGASGFVGTHLMRRWQAQMPQATIVGWAWEHEKAVPPSPDCLIVDIREAEAVRQACAEIKPDWVVHLAAQSFVPQSQHNPQETWEINCWGTFHLLEALRLCEFRGRLLFAGSGDQYGKVEEAALPILESQPLRPTNPYAASKAAAEMLCYQYYHGYGLDIVLARSFNHIGPAQSPRFVVSDFCRQVALITLGRREPSLVVGDLEVGRDFLDVRDVIDAYRCLLEKGRSGEPYNVCSGIERRLSELTRLITSFSPEPITVMTDPRRFRPTDTRRMWGSCEKLKIETGWQPQWDLHETLRDVFLYWKEEMTQ